MSGRWPLHPPPYPGEALSSWLTRIARALAIPPALLLRHNAAIHQKTATGYHLDFDPPEPMIRSLAESTGQEFNAVCRLTARGYVPSMLDSLDATPNSVAKYTHGLAILLPIGHRPARHPPVLPWYSSRRFRQPHGCRNCLAEATEPYLRLHWRFPWMLTCPLHQRRLEPFALQIPAARTTQASWVHHESHTAVAPSPLLRLDAITHQAITGGICVLPCGKVPGALWLRLLRTVLDELAVGIANAGRCGQTLKMMWSGVGHGYGYYLLPWRPYEHLDQKYQELFMLMAAKAFTDAFEQPALRHRLMVMAQSYLLKTTSDPTEIVF
jgi:hypothetical protein